MMVHLLFKFMSMLMFVRYFFTAECTFEYFVGSPSSICGWSQDGSDNFDWTRASRRTASYGTGPSFDHTYGTKQGKKQQRHKT